MAQFHKRSTYSFYARRSQKRKKTQMTQLYFLRFWDLQDQKLYVERWWNWHHDEEDSMSNIFVCDLKILLNIKSQQNYACCDVELWA